MTLDEAQKAVDTWIKSTGKGYFTPVTNVAVLAEEVGELAHVVLRRFGEQRPKKNDDISDQSITDELTDILWVTLALANQLGVDLTDAFQSNLLKKNTRDADRFED